MKKLFYALLIVQATFTISSAQGIPPGISYQAIALIPSIIFDNGIFVGIGNTNPNEKLEINYSYESTLHQINEKCPNLDGRITGFGLTHKSYNP